MDEGQFSAAVDSPAVTGDFSKLVEWIITELAAVDKLEEYVHSIDSMYIFTATGSRILNHRLFLPICVMEKNVVVCGLQ